MTQNIQTSLGELIATIYEEFLAQFGDEELASVATAALINDMLSTSTDDAKSGRSAA